MFLGRLAEPQSCSFPLKVKIGRNPALLLESIRVCCLGASSSASRLTYFPSPSTKAPRGAEQLGHLRDLPFGSFLAVPPARATRSAVAPAVTPVSPPGAGTGRDLRPGAAWGAQSDLAALVPVTK